MKSIKDFTSCLLLALLLGCAQPEAADTPSLKYNKDTNVHAPIIPTQIDQSCRDVIHKAEPNDILTLRDVLALALVHNPELNMFSLEMRAVQARELQAGLWPNPEIGVEVENVGGTGEFRGSDAEETTIELSQLLELGNKSRNRKRVASFEKELADFDYRRKKLDIFSDTAKAFIFVLKTQEKVQLSNELLKLSEESFRIVEKRVNAGKDSPVEINRAKVAMTNARITLHEHEQILEYARGQLASFWGQDKPLFRHAAGDLTTIEQLPALENLADRLKQNPEYLQWDTQIKKSRAMLDLERSNAVGDVTLSAGMRRFSETDNDAFVFGVSIPLPLSDRNQGAKQAAVYHLAQSREGKKAAWLKLQNELNQTYRELATAFRHATSLETDALPAATEMFNAATRAYEQGKLDYLNVLDTQRTLFEVKNDYLESLAVYHSAKTEIERLVGSQLQTINLSESGS